MDRWQELEAQQPPTVPRPSTLALSVLEGEPRVLDTDLAKALGLARPTNIRVTIEARRTSLEEFGHVAFRACNVAMPRGGVKEGHAYYLNEEQALYVTMHSHTERSNAVKVQVVKVFTAWRRGQLVPAQQAPVLDFSNPLAMAWFVQQQARTVTLRKVAVHGP